MGQLFGTDGIRGVANQYPITAEMAVRIGEAAARLFRDEAHDRKIVIGKDTRISGDMLEHAIAAGVCSAGLNALLAGVLPTPGIAFLTSSINACAGIMISASHNPHQDNGIKIFKRDGFKLSDAKESEIEDYLFQNEARARIHGGFIDPGNVLRMENTGEAYIDFLLGVLPAGFSLAGRKIVLDCSHGATYQVAPALFGRLGAEVEALFISPNGRNINHNCGSQHTETLCRVVRDRGADLGLAFDGDGDRLIAVDETGRQITGDQILYVCAGHMKKAGRLPHDLLVSTVMSNIGLTLALQEIGIKHVKAPVGDRYVLEKLLATGATLGGEDSGHLIFLEHHTTGDGILSALKLIEIIQASGRKLSELVAPMKIYPQVLLNIEVREKPDIQAVPEFVEAIHKAERALGEEGRVLVRYSGTQPKCRVMVEGPTLETTRQHCEYVAEIIRGKIGK